MQEINSKIAGISFNQDVISELKAGEELLLEREPKNKYDRNAIKILTSENKHLGYVNRKLAFDVALAMDSGVPVHCFVAQVTGLGFKTQGVNIQLRLGVA